MPLPRHRAGYVDDSTLSCRLIFQLLCCFAAHQRESKHQHVVLLPSYFRQQSPFIIQSGQVLYVALGLEGEGLGLLGATAGEDDADGEGDTGTGATTAPLVAGLGLEDGFVLAVVGLLVVGCLMLHALHEPEAAVRACTKVLAVAEATDSATA